MIELTHKHRDMIDDIMDAFNFERVHSVMVMLDWKWGTDGYIPDIVELRKTARDLLSRVITDECREIATGGFHAMFDSGVLRLMFVLEDYDSWYHVDSEQESV